MRTWIEATTETVCETAPASEWPAAVVVVAVVFAAAFAIWVVNRK